MPNHFLQSMLQGRQGAQGGVFGKADQFLQKPGGMMLLNLLAQEGFSTTPQSPLGAIGRAGLATQQQQQGQQQADLQRRLIEAQIGLAQSKAGRGGPNIGAIDPSKYDPASVAEFSRTGNFGVLKPVGQRQDVNKLVNELADDVRAESKEFEQQSGAYSRIVASAENPSPAGDLALIFNYMKVLDPGSTVREGEFANAENSAGVSNRVRQLYNKVIEGTRLSAPQRADFVNRAGRIFNSAVDNQSKRNERFRARGRNAQIPDEMIDPILPAASPVEIAPFNFGEDDLGADDISSLSDEQLREIANGRNTG